jgi:uncharacterized caspase-like protein
MKLGVIVLLVTVGCCPVVHGEGRLALVVGNSAYDRAPALKDPLNDAQDIAERLRLLGFQLVGNKAQLNVRRDQFARLIRELGRSARSGDTLLFYFAGHGVAYGSDNWLLPVDDRDIQTQEDVPDFAVSTRSVVERMEERGAGTNLLVLDACRDNPLPARTRSATRGLTRINVPSGTFVLYAASQGQTAIDGDGRNGLFTSILLERIAHSRWARHAGPTARCIIDGLRRP